MKNLLFLVALLAVVSCQKDVTSVASWGIQTWSATGSHDRGLAHFTEDDSLYFDWQGGGRKSTSMKVDRENRKGGDKITCTSKDTTFGTIHFIEQVKKNKEIRWQLGDGKYKEIFFTRE